MLTLILDRIEEQVKSGSLVIKLPDNTELKADQNSFNAEKINVGNEEETDDDYDDDDDDTPIIIGIVIAVVAVVGIILIVVIILIQKKKSKQKVNF